ncbi:MAG: histidine--tRNA ligase [Deltaproteobacteria bacterium]
MEIITTVKGFKDILPQETGKWQFVETCARHFFENFGFQDIRVPILEKTALFKRSIGETTDIVEKEMYTFLDRSDEYLTLRPEATAGIIRSYIEHNISKKESVSKLYCIGPMFRRERPQKGRFRQFHQINAEVIGIDSARIDAEVIFMLFHFLQKIGLPFLVVEINSLGCNKCRTTFRESVLTFLENKKDKLCADCVRRMNINPLRIFDCKVESCKEIMKSAPAITDFICSDCRNHFDELQNYLNDYNVAFRINKFMVRGLDYYTKTAFEVTTNHLGAQNAVCGGGRYDGLVKQLGGPDVSGIGFAIGFERLVSLLPDDDIFIKKPILFVAMIGEATHQKAFLLVNELRLAGISCETDYFSKSLKNQMKRADRLGCRFALIIGEDELLKKEAIIKNMTDGKQTIVSLTNIENIISFIQKEAEVV